MNLEIFSQISGIISSLIVILTFLASSVVIIINYFKPKIKYVDFSFGNNEKLLKKYPPSKYKLNWPLLNKIAELSEEKGFKKVYLWYGIRKYEFQVENKVPPSNHILMYKKIQ